MKRAPKRARLITVHVNPHRLKTIVRHPLVRSVVFILAIVISVGLDYVYAHSHYAIAVQVGGASVTPFVSRALEVLTDCACDRIFPQA